MWEVRRPFIPFASFAEHSDDVTGETCLINFGLSTFEEESIYHIFSIHTFLCALPLVSRNLTHSAFHATMSCTTCVYAVFNKLLHDRVCTVDWEISAVKKFLPVA